MKKYLTISLIIFLAGQGLLFAQPDIVSVNRTLNFYIRSSVDRVGNLYIKAWDELPYVFTFVNNDGSVTICTSSANTTYIYEYNEDLDEKREFSFQNELSSLGAFTKDNDGNYYFFYSKSTSNRNEQNMALVKYDAQGDKLNTYMLIANAPNSFGGVQVPFDAGTCRIEISGTMISVYFARKMFNGHQASYGFVLNRETFEKIDRGIVDNRGYTQTGNNVMPYVSHSFNQFIIPVDNGFVYADHGDAHPRAFAFSKFQDGSVTKKLNAFRFPGNTGANPTYAQFGGLAKTTTGFIFAGTYGRIRENPRNLFVLTFDDNLTACSNPIYLTTYTRNDGHAGHPKIVAINDGRYLLLWELFSYSTQSANSIVYTPSGYTSTFMLIINEKGEAVSETIELKNIRLNMSDTLRYNPRTGKVYWTIDNSNSGNSITIYALSVADIY